MKNKSLVILCIIGWLLAVIFLGSLIRTATRLAEEQIHLAEEQARLAEVQARHLAEEQARLAEEEERARRELGNAVKAHGALRVEGTRLMDMHGKPVTLRGVSSHGIEWYPRYLNGRAMQSLREAGANVIRLSMYTDTSHGYIKDTEQSLNYLYMGIESAMSQDLYVIVDWHILTDGNPLQYADEAVHFFSEISSRYGDEPGIIYEICNEPNGDTDWRDVCDYASRVIPAIRLNAPSSLILVGTPKYSTDIFSPMQSPLGYENIMYTLHCYMDASEPLPYHNYLIQKAVEAKLPIFVSEWGTTVSDEYTESGKPMYHENALPFIDYMQEHSISCCAWAMANGDKKHSLFRADCHKLSAWTQEDLTPFGKMVFDSFRQEAAF